MSLELLLLILITHYSFAYIVILLHEPLEKIKKEKYVDFVAYKSLFFIVIPFFLIIKGWIGLIIYIITVIITGLIMKSEKIRSFFKFYIKFEGASILFFIYMVLKIIFKILF